MHVYAQTFIYFYDPVIYNLFGPVNCFLMPDKNSGSRFYFSYLKRECHKI